MKLSDLLSPHEKQELLRLIGKLPTATPCNACVNYNCGNCQLCGEPIPAEVRDVGCEEWVFHPTSPPF